MCGNASGRRKFTTQHEICGLIRNERDCSDRQKVRPTPHSSSTNVISLMIAALDGFSNEYEVPVTSMRPSTP